MKKVDEAYLTVLFTKQVFEKENIDYSRATQIEKVLDSFIDLVNANNQRASVEEFPAAKDLATMLLDFYEGLPAYIMKAPRTTRRAGQPCSFPRFGLVDIATSIGAAAAGVGKIPICKIDAASRIRRKYASIL